MSSLRGEEGRVCFNASGTPSKDNDNIVGTTSWTLNISKDVLDVTHMGEERRRWIGSVYGAEGSITMLYDATANTERDAFIADVLIQEGTPDSQFSLFPKDTDANHSLNFLGIITGCEVGATVGELVELTMSFVVTGPVTSTLVA